MSHSIWTNLDVSEGTVTTTATITFAWKSRAIEILNDSGTRDLEFKFHASGTYATLKPKEAFSADFHSRQVLLNSPSAKAVPYRIKAMG